MAKYLSELFIEKPWQFGLSGDPLFWDYLEEYFSKVEFPYSETWFTDDIYRLFLEVSGEQLQVNAKPFVKDFAHGGMSSGHLSGEFWINRGIPLLVERYRDAICELK